MKKQAEEMGGLVLYLGSIDDVDVTYLNGTFLGQSGQMPPEYVTAYSVMRAYPIKIDQVLWDQENTIAVRVFDGGGGGGIVQGPISLSVIGMDELVLIEPQMERDDHLFLGEGPVNLKVRVKNDLKSTLQGEMILEAKSDFGKDIIKADYPVKVRSGKSTEIPVEMGELDPGFYNISLILKSDLDNKRYDFAIGVRPEEILSPLDRADDFDDYWKRARRELDAVAPHWEISWCVAGTCDP
jgi:hypothetical protein